MASPTLPTLPTLPTWNRHAPRRDRQPAPFPLAFDEAIPDLSEEERRGLLQRTMSLIGYIGGSVGKMGYGLRGIAAGEPAAALNFIPFYDTIRSVTDDVLPEATKVSGEELLYDRWDLGDKPEGWFTSPGDFGKKLSGVGVDLIDPIMFVGGPLGSMTTKGLKHIAPAAKLAEGAGQFGKGVAQLKAGMTGASETGNVLTRTGAGMAKSIREGMRGGLSISHPFTGKPFVNPLTGKEMVYGAGSEPLAKAWEALYYGRFSPIPTIRSQFSRVPKFPATREATAQIAADMRWIDSANKMQALQNFKPVAVAAAKQVENVWNEAARHASKSGDTLGFKNFTSWASEWGDKIPDPDVLVAKMREQLSVSPNFPIGRDYPASIWNVPAYSGPEVAGRMFYEFFDGLQTSKNLIRQHANELGADIAELDSLFVGHMARQPTASVIAKSAEQREELMRAAARTGTRYDFTKHRAAYLDLPMGTEAANNAAMDALLRGKVVDPTTGAVTKMAAKDEHAAMLEFLTGLGVEVSEKTPRAALRREYLWQRHLRPGIARASKEGRFHRKAAEDILGDATPEGLLRESMETLRDPEKQASILKGFDNLPDDTVVTGLFDRPLVEDTFKYIETGIDLISNLQSQHHFLTGPGIVKSVAGLGEDATAALRTEGWVPITEAWEEAGNAVPGLHNWLKQHKPGMKPDQLGELLVDPKAAKALQAYKAARDPKVQAAFMKAFEKYASQPWKLWLTLAPAFYVRNYGGGWWQAVADAPQHVLNITRGFGRVAKALWKGESTPFLDDLVAGDGLSESSTQMMDLIGQGMGRGLPTGVLGGAYKKLHKKEWVLPDDWRGASGLGTFMNKLGFYGGPKGPIGQFHRGLHNYVETLIRGGQNEGLRMGGLTHAEAMAAVTRSQFDYSKLSTFERHWMRPVIPFYGWLCVPDHSEILTRNGWKTCDTLAVGDIALTYSTEKDRLEWQPVEGKAIFPHNGNLMRLHNSRLSFDCTPNHKWPVLYRAETVDRGYNVYSYPERRVLKEAQELNTKGAIVQTAELSDDEPSLLTPKEARLLGWILTDGYYRWRRKSLEVVIYQSHKKFLKEVIQVAGGKAALYTKNGVFMVRVLQAYLTNLKPLLEMSKKDDGWVKVVTQLSREAAQAMYDAMMLADGCTSPRSRRGGSRFNCQMPGVAAAFQVLSFMVGRPCGRQMPNGFYSHRRRHIQCSHLKKETVPYKGRVWCPTTENGTWVMRQHGVVTITGNSNNIPLQITRILERPGGMTGQAMRMMTAKRREGEYTPAFIQETLGIPVGGPPEETSYLTQSGIPIEDLRRIIFKGGLPAPIRSVEKLASNIHPLLTFVPEQIAGKQFFTGRELSSLEPMTGSRSLDAAIHHSPWSRQVSDAQKLLDERKPVLAKAANLLTGFRVGTYDIEKMQLRELQNALGERLLSEVPWAREFPVTYLPKHTKERLSKTPAGREKLAEAETIQRWRSSLGKMIRQIQKRREAAGVE